MWHHPFPFRKQEIEQIFKKMRSFALFIFLTGISGVLIAQNIGKVATGNYPDIAVDSKSNIHIVYNYNGLKYKRYNATDSTWGDEMDVACDCDWVGRQDPDIVIDSLDRPHVLCGNFYARLVDGVWKKINPFTSINRIRDSELAIDAADNIYLVHRQGFSSGHIALQRINAHEETWEKLSDPDKGDDYGDISNHVYTDIAISPVDSSIHIVQRHGPDKPYEIAYRYASHEDFIWARENVDEDRKEAPHIIVNHSNTVFISAGNGNVFRRAGKNNWINEGRVIHAEERTQPEMCTDSMNNIYIACFGGEYNIRKEGKWGSGRNIPKQSAAPTIGFVESYGCKDYCYIVWEEGTGNADDGLAFSTASIYVAKLNADGTIEALIKEELNEEPGEEPGDDPNEEPGEEPGVYPGENPNDDPGDDPNEEPTNGKPVIENEKLQTYPNPVKNQLYVRIAANISAGSIRVLNMYGENQYQLHISDQDTKEINIPTANLLKGVYIVILENREGTFLTGKFVK